MTIPGDAVAERRAATGANGADVLRSDSDRLAALFDRHHERIFRLALRLLGDRQAALDLVQETFLRALGSLDTLPTAESTASAWLSKVALNLARDHWRRHGVRRRWAQEHPFASASGPDPAPADRLAVREALAELSPRQRAIVLMAEVEGMDSLEIGTQLGLRPVTVRWHLSAARRRLRSRLDVQGTEAPGGTR